MKNNLQMRYTISQKFLGSLIPSIMLVVLLTGSIMIGRESAALNEELLAKGEYMSELAAIMLDPPIWNMNIREIDRVVNALIQNNEIVGARVLDTEQEILFTSAMPQSREALLEFACDVFQRESGEKIGHVQIYLTHVVVEQKIRRAILSMSLIMLALMATIILLNREIQKRLIARPIRNLREGIVHSLDEQTYSPVPILAEDELGFVTRAFNTVMLHLKENALHLTRMVAELTQAENALRESEARYRSLFDRVPVGLYRTTPDGKILDANLAFAQLFGYASREALSAHSSLELYADPTDRVRWQMLMAQQEVVRDFEVRFRRPDGAIFWVKNTGRAMKNAHGLIAAYEGSLEDITERKQAEALLEEERNLLRTMIDHIPDLIYVKDAKSRFMLANLATLHSLGLTELRDLIGKTDFDLHPRELAEQYFADEQAIFASGQPLINREEPSARAGGGMRWLLSTKVPFRDLSGALIGLIGINRDITERKQDEEELLQLKQAVEAMPIGVTISDLTGRIRYVNPAEADLHGYQVGELLGQDIGIFAPPEFRQPITLDQLPFWQGLKRESVNLRQNGSRFPVWLMSELIRASRGEPFAIVTSCEDITERKRAEEELTRYRDHLEELVKDRTAALRASETEYRLLFENLQDVFIRVNEADIVLLASPSIILTLGYLQEMVTGKPITDTIIANPEQWRQCVAAIRTGGFVTGFELQLRHWSGAWLWGSISAQMYRDDASGAHIFEGTIRDISKLKQAEAELQATNAGLQETLTHLRQAQQELIQAEKMAALGKLIANVAHEINTPLGAIRASARTILTALDETFLRLPEVIRLLSDEQQAVLIRLIQRACQPKQALTSKEERQRRRALTHQMEDAAIAEADTIADTLVDMGISEEIAAFTPLFRHEKTLWLLGAAANIAAQRHSSENILFAVERMSKIVFALKSYAHSDASGQPTLARIQDGMEIVLTLYYNQLKHGIEVVKQYDDAPPISCYPDELQQVWTNLIHNAMHAMHGKGRLEITVKPTPCPSEEGKPTPPPSEEGKQSTPLLGGAGGGAGIVVEITDSGCGIPDEIKPRIFEPFFTTKPAGEGSGLGLDICKKIIEKHQGKIEVESQPGRTTFRVWLPQQHE